LNEIQDKAPKTLQQIAEITNRISTLRNETNSQILDLKEGIENSIGGAIEGFFDAVLAGNESILTSFRRVVAQMLIEIGKLIFQAFVLKAVMSLVQNALGGLFGGGAAGAAGGGAGAVAPFEPFAEGGYTGDGPASAPAGIVHRGEYVTPAHVVRRPGVLSYLENMRSGAFLPKLRGYATGGLVGGSSGRSGGGGGAVGGMKQRIINIVDKALVSDYLNSAEGEEIILNIIGKNPGVVQRLA
jgi:phage-related minor tail protein